jgi:dihydroxyacetone kinase
VIILNNTKKSRNLKYIEIYDSKVTGNLASSINKNGYGLYLIGLDGSIKKYSQSTDIIDNLFIVIDAMPMRKGYLNQ